MYSLDEAQKGIGNKPPNQKEVQKVIFHDLFQLI
jgi:hypothetical protein